MSDISGDRDISQYFQSVKNKIWKHNFYYFTSLIKNIIKMI